MNIYQKKTDHLWSCEIRGSILALNDKRGDMPTIETVHSSV